MPRFFRAMLVYLVVLATSVTAVLGLAQTASFKRIVENRLAVALAAPDGTPATVAGLEGFLPFEIRLAQLVLRDNQGAWLRLWDVHSEWSPRRLLRGVLLVPILEAGRIEVIRPRSGDARQPNSPSQLTPLSGWLTRLEVPDFRVGVIELGEAFTGQPATFSLEGHLRKRGRHPSQASEFELNAVRTDEPTATLRVAAALERSRLAFSVLARETGNLLAAATREPTAGDLSFHLDGEGPLEEWEGHLALRADGLLTADLAVGLDLEQTPRIVLAGHLRPHQSLLPPIVGRLAGERVHLLMTALLPEMGDVSFEQVHINTELIDLHGQGRADLAAGGFSAELHLKLSDLAALGPIGGRRLGGQADVEVSAAGAWVQPAGAIRIRVPNLLAGGLRGDAADLKVVFKVLQPLAEGKAAASFRVSGAVDRLELPGVTLVPLAEVRWRADATLLPTGSLRVSRLRIETGAGSLLGSATLDAATLAGRADIDLNLSGSLPDPLSYGPKIGGDLDLKATVRSAPHLAAINVDLSGVLERLSGIPENVEILLGKRMTLKALVEIAPWEDVVLRDLSLGAGLLQVSGNARVDLASKDLGGGIELSLFDLSPLEPVLGAGISGAAAATIVLYGRLDAPRARVVAEGRELLFAGEDIDRIKLEIEGLSKAPEGIVSATLVTSDMTASVRSAYKLTGPKLILSDVVAAADRSRIAANLSFDISNWLVEGSIGGTVPDLRPFQWSLGHAPQGEVEFEAHLEAKAGRQNAEIGLTARYLEYLGSRLTQVIARARIDDAFNDPIVNLSFELNGVEVEPDIRLDQATLRAKGGPRSLMVDARSSGHAMQGLEVTVMGLIDFGEKASLRLTELSGAFGGEPFGLAAPVYIEIAPQALVLQALDFHLGEARLTASARVGRARSSLDAELTGLPLRRIAALGGPRLEGTAAAVIRLDGPALDPTGRMEVVIRNFRPTGTDFEDALESQIELTSVLADQRLRTNATVKGLTSEPMLAVLELPLVLALLPVDVQVPEEGAVSGRLDLKAQLERITAIIGLDDQRLGGSLAANLELKGTAGVPAVFGRVSLVRGVYENGATGTVLQDIDARLEIQGDRARLEDFTASDGGNGWVDGHGALTRTEEGRWWLDTRVTLERAALIRREDVTAALSGNLHVTGSFNERLDISGQLTVDRAVLTWEDDPRPDIPYVAVEEIGKVPRTVPAETSDDRAAATIGLDVDLAIPRRLFARGRGLDSEWHGSLQVRGTSLQPALSGQLVISRGRINFLGNRFIIGRGTIDFSGVTPPNPTLDLEASSRGRNIRGVIRVTGAARDARLHLESVPPLPEDEVLAELLFGRPARDLGPDGALMLAQALNMLRDGEGPDLLRRAREALGFETLALGSGERAGEVSLRAGSHASENVFVEVEQGSGARSSGRAALEVNFGRRTRMPFRLGAELTGRGASGAGAMWQFDY